MTRAMTRASKRAKPNRMSDWKEARVASIAKAADGLLEVRLDVPAEVAASHVAPGQYVKVAAGAGETFFAIASRPNPDGGRIELLLKLGSPVSDAIAELLAGAAVRVTSAQGKGFPLDRAVGRDLVLVATGSGISPIRSVIETIARRRADFGKVSLHVGARTPSAFAYVEEFSAWRASEIDVFPVVSRPTDTGWTGLTGYVQSHLDGVHLRAAIAFLCGQKAMVEAVRTTLVERGMPGESIYLNF
jgi:sulfhydrogenase subunit gamma (sulfur reductase)